MARVARYKTRPTLVGSSSILASGPARCLRQVSTPNRPNASSVLQLHEVGSAHVSSGQNHGRLLMGGDGVEARSRRT
ncbi:hypothetical protein N7466_001534 [Penicillium verhagenii]|uniref:uncharacterized protein n=1 Tax=Penicillium verhagenii TaxID=1562060 RepID=UPI002545984A|nr:uncharacterized protein N7466_001534 [Penicillium verhagenii]KAJ5938400.1 hypothetical protein N7466_001534 [Penicillium verhagenii]